jgi:magnesium transporter
LKGVVPTRRLLLNPPDKPVAEIMVERVIAIPTSATVLDACEFFTLHRYWHSPSWTTSAAFSARWTRNSTPMN